MLSGIALILGTQTPSQGWSCWGGALLGAGQAGTDSGLGANTVLSTNGRQTRLGSWEPYTVLPVYAAHGSIKQSSRR